MTTVDQCKLLKAITLEFASGNSVEISLSFHDYKMAANVEWDQDPSPQEQEAYEGFLDRSFPSKKPMHRGPIHDPEKRQAICDKHLRA